MSLLGLPQALRDRIVEEIIPTRLKPRISSPFLQTFKEAGKIIAEQECRLIWPKDPKSWERNCGLLLTNHQLHYDVSQRVRSLKIPITYELDVLVDHERLVWPTWTYIPILHNHIDTLTMTVRISGSCGRFSSALVPTVAEEMKERCLAFGEDGKPHPIDDIFRDLITEIFSNGPARGLNSNSSPGSPLFVKQLNILIFLLDEKGPDGFEVAHECSNAPPIIGWHGLENPCYGRCGSNPDLQWDLRYLLDLDTIEFSFIVMLSTLRCLGGTATDVNGYKV
ncbi:hypothetical protein BU16DRAFT_623052 [Lophium mytilinum]|uniref:F-box domain-containing protein n=1 Tax=Lophium mytilinum TaxID=390894 RepID=A0A6A6QBP1_9PEZI|nr:hypothetical protein BU16DRAFT_623052 [Lophium mytilinum]